MTSPLALNALLPSVVRVYAVVDPRDYEQPWQRQGPHSTTGSGVAVEVDGQLRVLTNAHCVEHEAYVEVRRYGQSCRVEAQVEALGHDCDLALLRVEDKDFSSNVPPVRLGELPGVGDGVSVLGYPIGGERLSVTRGVVSRIDLVRYSQSQRNLLALQVDAAINSGNSGGPVVLEDRLVGLAFQTLDDAEVIGYVIPVPVVKHFLESVARGTSLSFPSLGLVSQALESPAHRRMLGLDGDPRGVLVCGVGYGGTAHGVIREGDVLLSFDGEDIAPDGSVALRNGERIHFSYGVSTRHVGDEVPLTVFREGARRTLTLTLGEPLGLVVQGDWAASADTGPPLEMPAYFVYGGFVFAPVSREYLRTWSDPWWQTGPKDLLSWYEQGVPTAERQQLVVIQKVLADRSNRGFHDLDSVLLREVNGERVSSLRHLVSLVEGADGDYLTLLADDGRRFVIDRAAAEREGARILESYGVPRDRSAGL